MGFLRKILKKYFTKNKQQIDSIPPIINKEPLYFINMSVLELLSHETQDNVFNRFDIIVRYLAIENYYGKNNYGFELYNKMQINRANYLNSDLPHTDERFKNLIKSVETVGFLTDKHPITINGLLKLKDGSHRVALALYHKIERLNFIKIDNNNDINYKLSWFKDNNFTEAELEIIKNKYNTLKNELSWHFVVVLWSPVNKYFSEITTDLAKEYNVLEFYDKHFSNDYDFQTMIKALYKIDDIADWKVAKKLEFMTNYPKTFRVIKLDFPPEFRRKKINSQSISITVEKIKNHYRNLYKDKIPNYFFDIIMHIGDNYEHSDFMNMVLSYNCDITPFLNSIKDKQYCLTKVDTHYNNHNFPKETPLNKDIDILCSDNDFNFIKEKATEFIENFMKSPNFKLRCVKKDNGIKLRIEYKQYLLYQIDLSTNISGTSKDFVNEVLNSRELNPKGFYQTSIDMEIIIRFLEYTKNPKKEYHLEYIKKNKHKTQSELENILSFIDKSLHKEFLNLNQN
ncbi:MAG: hypothetical protein LBH40_07110 [Alphaproteobacteria bacterium]|jgi:hypothetical protein|nr:hypothetical protein [Alphaproteobacteria bacterium]